MKNGLYWKKNRSPEVIGIWQSIFLWIVLNDMHIGCLNQSYVEMQSHLLNLYLPDIWYFCRAPDKLLGQLGIYATWLSSIAYLQNQLCIYLFLPHVLMSAMFFLLNVAIGNLPAYIYSLTSFAFLEYQTSGFYHTSEANLVPLLIFIAWIHIASFASMFFSH